MTLGQPYEQSWRGKADFVVSKLDRGACRRPCSWYRPGERQYQNGATPLPIGSQRGGLCGPGGKDAAY